MSPSIMNYWMMRAERGFCILLFGKRGRMNVEKRPVQDRIALRLAANKEQDNEPYVQRGHVRHKGSSIGQ